MKLKIFSFHYKEYKKYVHLDIIRYLLQHYLCTGTVPILYHAHSFKKYKRKQVYIMYKCDSKCDTNTQILLLWRIAHRLSITASWYHVFVA